MRNASIKESGDPMAFNAAIQRNVPRTSWKTIIRADSNSIDAETLDARLRASLKSMLLARNQIKKTDSASLIAKKIHFFCMIMPLSGCVRLLL